jgi:cell wall-associated NlpC family hydrolase
MRNIAMDASGPVDGRAVAAYATQTAQLFKNQELQEKYGALQVLNKTIESAVNPSDMTLSLLQRLGGTSARIAQSRRDSPIRLPDPVFYDEDDQAPPGKPVGELGPGVVLQVDNEDELPASSVGLVVEAKKWLGTKYSFGAGGNQGPTVGRTGKGFDCSGFIKYLMFQEFGIDLPHLASAQAKIGKYIDKPENLRPGDAIFFGTKGKEGHEGLYIGNGQFIHAPKTGDVVKISSLKSDYYKQRFVGGRRYGAAVRRKQEQKDGRQA